MEVRCRWCDRALPEADAECALCAEQELMRRLGKRGDPARVRRVLCDVLRVVDVSAHAEQIAAYDEAVRTGEGLLAVRRRLQMSIESEAAPEWPQCEAANRARARVEMLEAILAYPYDHHQSLQSAARASARVQVWPAALRVVPAGPPPEPTEDTVDLDESFDEFWTTHTAWELAWMAAYRETLELLEKRLYWRLLRRWRSAA